MNKISDELKKFIYLGFDSVEQLDVLLLIHGHPDREWTFSDISRELRSTDASIEKRSRTLEQKSIIAEAGLKENTIRYIPYSPSVDRLVTELAQIYKTQQYKVMDLIFNKEKAAIESFADSFRIKKEEKE
jgi:hypothetical protein